MVVERMEGRRKDAKQPSTRCVTPQIGSYSLQQLQSQLVMVGEQPSRGVLGYRVKGPKI